MRALIVGFSLLAVAATVVGLIPVRATIPKLTERPGGAYWSMNGGYRIAYVRLAAAEVPVDVAAGEVAIERSPIVVTHGGPGGYIHSSYIETFGRLTARGHDVYLYDQLGSGLSERLERPLEYDFKRHADDLLEIVTEQIGAEHAILVGQSYGGKLVSYVAAHHPERVAAAVLTSPGVLEPPLFDEEGRWINEALYPVPEEYEFHDPADLSDVAGLLSWGWRPIVAVAVSFVFNRKWMPDDEADGVLNTVATKITRRMACDPKSVPPEEGGGGFYSHGWSNDYREVEDWREALRRTPVPALVLHGQCDYIPYAATYEYADLMPNGEYRFIEDAGHVIWWEEADALVEEIELFLDRIDAAAGGAL